MRQRIRHFEPFIFLPVGIIQDKLFYINPDLEAEYIWLKEKVFSNIENEIIIDNVVKVFQCRKSVIIMHIYPLQYKEPISGRGGQVLVLGYIISKELIRKYFEGVVFRINIFFNLIEQLVRIYFKSNSYDIPTDFVKLVNDEKCDRQKIIDRINLFVINSNNNWNNYVWNKQQNISPIRHFKKVTTVEFPESSSKLFDMYKFLRDRNFKNCIILINCKNYTQYMFPKKTELIQIFIS